ncbi:PREDICTED: selenoprotein K-like [Branchiostoma belcheri]|uniref:Selenoprotein K n=1 Tax=Branchiostoma belcheri TaxID=7741 RepID=A0A6P4Z8T3_BRABE|nr:PREDICTED: selenoprotein K-like [Branchiostoma belcheri]
MAYVTGGQMLDSRSPWRLSIIPEIFWGIINFIVLFFQTMYNPSLSKHGSDTASSYSRGDGRGPPPPPPRRRFGGVRRGGAPGPPPMAGGG